MPRRQGTEGGESRVSKYKQTGIRKKPFTENRKTKTKQPNKKTFTENEKTKSRKKLVRECSPDHKKNEQKPSQISKF